MENQPYFNGLLADDNPAAAEKRLRKFLVDNWGQKDGERILQLKLNLKRQADNPKRIINQNVAPIYYDELEQELECDFLAWKP